MEASPIRPPLLIRPPSSSARRRLALHRPKPRLSTNTIRSSRDDGGETIDHGRVVDDNMTSLRTRIKEMKASDRVQGLCKQEKDWKEWEKEFNYTFHDSEVCEVLGLMQLLLMSTQPAAPKLAIKMTMIVTVNVPTSVLVVAMHVMDAFEGILGVLQELRQ